MSLRRILLPLVPLLFICACKLNSESGKEGSGSQAHQQPFEKEKIAPAEFYRYKQRLAANFDTMLLNRNFNGGILVAKGGNILYETYVGYADPTKQNDTITANTAFHLASTSKPFTGVAIMKLIDEQKINLDDEIRKYFPGFPYSGVTIRHLLTHRSGLPNYLYFMDDKQKWNQTTMVSNKDVIDFLIGHQPPKTASPGTRFQYSNTNYVLLASVIEKVSGKAFPQYMKETIFEPLGMTNTFVYTPADSTRALMSYKPSGALWANDKYENTYGDKNVYSTPRDMFKWDSALYREDFVKKEILDSSFVPRSNEKPGVHNYGYGWRMLNLRNGKNVIYHFGKWHGFTPAFARLTDEKAVIIILGNQYSQSMYEAAKRTYNIFGDYITPDSTMVEDDTLPTGPVDGRPPPSKEAKKPVKKSEKVVPKKTPEPKVVKSAAAKKTARPEVKQTKTTQKKSVVNPAPVKKTKTQKSAAQKVATPATKKKSK